MRIERVLYWAVNSMYRIMLAEDEPSVLKNLKAKIENSGMEKFRVVETASTAEEAWEKMQTNAVDIIISDIRMPGLGGLWLFEQVRKNYPDIICIALSAYSEFEYLQQCIRIGIEDYYLKPISFEQVKEKLEHLEILIEAKKKDHEIEESVKKYQFDNADLCEKIDKYIKIHYADGISLKEIAEFLGYSSQYISEIYKKKRTKTIGDALQEYRLLQAKSLIRNHPKLSFTQVAEMVGYTDYRYFSRVFKKQFGITLTEFKENEDRGI